MMRGYQKAETTIKLSRDLISVGEKKQKKKGDFSESDCNEVKMCDYCLNA
jgi:hypothetical protein